MAILIDDRIVNVVTRRDRLLTELDYNGVKVWPVATHISTFVFDLPLDDPSVDLWLTQSDAGAVHVTFDDQTVMTSNALKAEFQHTFAFGGTHTVTVGVMDGYTWRPGAEFESLQYTFVGKELLHDDTADETLRSIQFGLGIETDVNSSAWFRNCAVLASVDFAGSDMNAVVTSAFDGCAALQRITWNDLIAEIYPRAFAGTTALTEEHIPATIERVWRFAFDHSGLRLLEIAVKTVDTGAFSNCEDLEYIWLRNSVQTVTGLATLFATEQWVGCSPGARLYCEALQKPVAWGSEFDAYSHRTNVAQSDPDYYLRYRTVWGQLREPWVAFNDLCIMGPVTYSMEIKRPYAFSDTATEIAEGASIDILTMVSSGIAFHGVAVFSDVAEDLAEELNDEQHDISGAYVYTGEVQEASMNSENANENLNEEEIAVTGVTMEVDT